MLRKENEIKWTVESCNYFDQINKSLTEAPVLISPDYSKDFIIFSFTSFDTVAVVLLQKNVEGLEKPFVFFNIALRDVELKYDIMDKQVYSLIKSIKAFRVYVLHSRVISYVPLAYVKEILIQHDIDGKRSKWIAKILEFNLEIKPTKLVKCQGLTKLLAGSNCTSLGVNFINTCSENYQAKLSDKGSQVNAPLVDFI